MYDSCTQSRERKAAQYHSTVILISLLIGAGIILAVNWLV